MPENVLVLDFDGTVTDVEEEGKPFTEGYITDLAEVVEQSLIEVQKLHEGFLDELVSNPNEYGFIYNGKIVAPAVVDPYLRIMPFARRLLDQFGKLLDEEERATTLQDLFKSNYQKTDIAFRAGVAESLAGLEGKCVYIVTNSDTGSVKNKLRALGDNFSWLEERTIGNAKKYAIDDEFDKVQEAMQLDGLKRPVWLRRAQYYEVLQEIAEREGIGFEDIAVVGDIFELDLALPMALGMHIGLVPNQYTPRYEINAVKRYEKGRVITDISAESFSVEQIAIEAEVEESQLLEETVQGLNDINPDELAHAKDQVYARQKLCRRARELLEDGEVLPVSSHQYVALKQIGEVGVPRWKQAAYKLKEQRQIPDDEFQAVVDETRKPRYKVVHGIKGDANYVAAKQLEFFTEGQAPTDNS